MKRRAFSARLIGAGIAAALVPGTTFGQAKWVEGKQYIRLSQPVPNSAAPGQIEVIEFFWYGCPHCSALEPVLETWVRQLPADVSFRRVPVAFSAEPFVAHQRIFYALDSLGQIPAMQRKIFYAIHQDHLRLDQPAQISAFMAANGIDSTAFMAAFNSFGTLTRVRQANQLVSGYKIDGVPAFGVGGRFYTSGALVGDNVQALAVTNFLIEQVRQSR